MDFGEEFHPPHFQVKEFNLDITEDRNLALHVSYIFDKELYSFLKEKKPGYYLSIKYPSRLSKILGNKKSDLVKRNVISDSETSMSFDLNIKKVIPEDVSNKEIENIINQLEGYQLIILNKNKYPIHIIDDIYYYSDYDLDLSETLNR